MSIVLISQPKAIKRHPFGLYIDNQITLMLPLPVASRDMKSRAAKSRKRKQEERKMIGKETLNQLLTDEVKEKIEDLRFNYEYVGVRFQALNFKLGPIDHVSHIWYDGNDTGIGIDGLCAVHIDKIDSLEKFSGYYGDHCAIICGNHATWGEDSGEIIINDPICEVILQ